MPTPLLLLCGGQSRRMGSPKPLLIWQGQTLIQRLVGTAVAQRPVWLAAADEHYPHTEGAVYLADALPNRQGPLPAILPALQQAAQHNHHGVYVMACDTLLLPETLINLLAREQQHPVWRDGLTALADGQQRYPLLAHWATALAAPLQRYLDQGGRRVMSWADSIPCHSIAMPAAWRHLSNFNTRADFARAQSEWEQTCHSTI